MHHTRHMHPQPAATSTNTATRLVLPWLLTLMLLVSAPFAFAKNYTYTTDGTVTDPSTGLTWMRCAMGQTWTGSTCSGDARTYSFDEANALTGTVTFAGKNDWRLPNIRELQTLVDRTVYDPAIDSVAFPNTQHMSYMSFLSSPSTTRVYFFNGTTYSGAVRSDGAVRLVRGGESFSALLNIARPTSDYVDRGDGTVTHTPTNLTWKRCAEGQTWTGSTCSGDAMIYNFDQANALTGTTAFAGQNDWRLPTLDELLSLVDYSLVDYYKSLNYSLEENYSSIAGVAMNTSIFPVTPTAPGQYWSNSPGLPTSQALAVIVYYGDGNTYSLERDMKQPVRLVRGGPSWGTTAPVCTLLTSPSASVVAVGARITLVANCTPAVTRYTWSDNACPNTTGSTCTVRPTATASYSVLGVNAATGKNATASVTVTVATPPASTLQASTDGTVTDAKTGLTWMRCAMGQTWTGSTCSGEANAYTSGQANALTGNVTFAGQRDWRLPNIRELQTIVNWSAFDPAIDTAAFPNMHGSDFWSSTPQVRYSKAWCVSFYSIPYLGTSNANCILRSNETNHAVRLVRGGESSGALLRITRPTSDYVDHGDGTVTHTPTRLTWKRCAVGQTWTGSTCSGEATTYTFEQASALTAGPTYVGQNDWRLPTEEELLSLVDYSIYGPALNRSIFPSLSGVWSNAPYVNLPGGAWSVNFIDGDTSGVDQRLFGSAHYHGDYYYSNNAVLLVRNAVDSTAATTPPVCTLSASPVVIAAGGSATLRVSCTPAATSYGWINSGFGDTTASGTVSPTATTLYGVVGRNAAGGGTIASAAVYVCNTPPVQNYSPLVPGGTAANDQLASSTTNDSLDGAAGIDTVRYNCNRSSFTVTKTASGWTVGSQSEGLDTLSNVERLRFGDETLALDISGNAGQAYRLYQAAFNRTPDNEGLKYWIGQLDAGMPLQEVAARFIDSAEFRQLYGTNPNNADFLTRLYNNVLHRTPDAGGYAWWLNQLNTGAHSPTTALMGFSESPENQAGVLNAIINGIDLLN